MSYKDDFLASLDGVPFFTERHTTVVGRRTAKYRLPFEDRGVAHLDLGRAPREFKIKAFLLEISAATLRSQRDALLKVLESPGSKLLVHPVYGRVKVVIDDKIALTESTAEGGQCEIDFEATESRDTVESTPRPDTKSTTVAAARTVRIAAGNSFEKRFSIADLPDFVGVSNLAVLDDVIRGLTDLNQVVGSVLAVPANFAAQINRISLEAATLINTPRLCYNTVDATIASVIDSVRNVTGRNRKGLGSLSSVAVAASALGEDTAEPSDLDTPSRNQERLNRSTMLIAMRASALAAAAETAANSTYTSSTEANEILQTLTDLIGNLSDNAIDGVEPDVEVFDALRDLLAALTAQLSIVAGALKDLTVYSSVDTLPALVIAYNLYGDATRVDELLERNPAVVHPNLVPGKLELEVLAP